MEKSKSATTDIEHLPDVELTDGVIVLRPFRFADAAVHLAGEDEEQIKWLGEGNKSTQQTVEGWIARNQKSWVEGGPVFSFAIRTVEGNQQVGQAEVNTGRKESDELLPGDANVSYSLYPEGRGRGLASRAVLLLEPFMREKGIKRAVIRVAVDNIASVKVPHRCGYTEQGVVTIRGENLASFVKDLS